MEAYPDIIAVLKEADERRISTFGGTWHSDFSFLDEPPSADAAVRDRVAAGRWRHAVGQPGGGL
jgi:hypothetical protein